MNIKSTAYVLLILLLTESAYCRPAESVRFDRGALREYADDKSDPNFWPVRGRRAVDPLRRGGRKTKQEETGVFWAGRGRSSEGGLLDEDGFWAHRGRDIPDESNRFWTHRGRDLVNSRLTVDEPGWTWKGRRRSEEAGDDEPVVPCFGGNRNEKREILREKLCELKRKSGSQLLREVPAGVADQFWPLRGRKRSGDVFEGRVPDEGAVWEGAGKRAEEDTWPEGLTDLKTFWPTRGKRHVDTAKVGEEARIVS